LLLLALALTVVLGCEGTVPAPTEFVPYHSADGKFSCDYPKGWEVEKGAGRQDAMFSYAKFRAGGAEISVEADFAGSLFGDMAKAGNGASLSGDASPAARVHANPITIKKLEEEFSNYKEREGKNFTSKGLGEGRRSMFTADQTFGGKLFGYRATLLSGDRRITVKCTCPSSNWSTLKPAFEKVISSLRIGGN
jgi:hypothetical protein